MNFKIPIFEYPSTNYFRAFLLYSIVGALIASIAVHVRLEINKNKFGFRKGLGKWLNETFGQKYGKGSIFNNFYNFNFCNNFISLSYDALIFGWGGGMLVNKKSVIKKSYF